MAFAARLLLNTRRRMRLAECSDLARPREARRRRARRVQASRWRARLAGAVLAALASTAVASRAEAQAPAEAGIAVDARTPLWPGLLARAASPDPAVRLAAVPSLQAAGTHAAWSLLVTLLQRDLDARVREAAAVALGASSDPDLLDVLDFAAHADPDPAVRAAAAGAHAALRPFSKRPKAAAGFSVLCPGCGYFYLGQPARAAAFLGSAGGLLAATLLVERDSPDGDRAMPLVSALQNLWFYGIYASYRDARLARGDRGARFPVAREGLTDLILAPFDPRVLRSPWVWAGLPLMLGAAVGASYLLSRVSSSGAGSNMRTLGDPGGVQFFGRNYGTKTGFALGEGYNLSLYGPVGVGEEALFRGVVQAGLSETSLGLWGGWAVGSAIFGGVHVFNFIGAEDGVKTAALAVPYLMLTGSYLGLVYIRTSFSLRTGVAVHFWYDFAIATLSFIADPDGQPFVTRFSMPF
jgi:membrane protease YdiL (CAAX protease family)